MAVFLSRRWRRQPQGAVQINETAQQAALLLHPPSLRELANNRTGTRSSVTISSIYDGVAAKFPNTAGQGWVFPSGVIKGRAHSLLVVGDPQLQNTQRNCVINQRNSSGSFVGLAFNAVPGTGGAITISQGSVSYQSSVLDTANDSAYISGAITGKTSAYLFSRNGTGYVAAVDGKAFAVSVQAMSNYDCVSGDELKIGDLGAFSGTGYGYSGSILLAAIWNRSMSQAEANSITENPWQLFKPARPIIYSISSASAAPTLSLATAVNITSSSAQPRVTVTF